MEASTSNKRRRAVRTRSQQVEDREDEEQSEGQGQEHDHEGSDREARGQEASDDNSGGEEAAGAAARNQPAATKDLKLKMPEFRGKKGRDPQVHLQAFESWATLQQLPKVDWKACFPQTLKGSAQKWYFNFPSEKLTSYKATSRALI